MLFCRKYRELASPYLEEHGMLKTDELAYLLVVYVQIPCHKICWCLGYHSYSRVLRAHYIFDVNEIMRTGVYNVHFVNEML